MWKGNEIFGNMNNLPGPILFLARFVVSGTICALIALAYPFPIFWDKKITKEALQLVAFTAL